MRRFTATVLLVLMMLMAAAAFTSVIALEQHRVAVSVEPLGSGVVEGGGIYGEGDVAVLKARPAEGWKFSHWMSDHPTLNGSTYNPVSFSVTQDVEAVAVFTEVEYVELLVTSNASEVAIPYPSKVERGGVVTVTAPREFISGDVKYVFAGWSGGIEEEKRTQNPVALRMDRSRAMTALYLRYIRFQDEWFVESDYTTLLPIPIPIGEGWRYDVRGWIMPELNNLTLPATCMVPDKYASKAQPITFKQCLVNFSLNTDNITVEAALNGSTISIPSDQWLDVGRRYVLALPTEHQKYVFKYIDNPAETDPVYEFTASGPMEVRVNYELSPFETYMPYQLRTAVNFFLTDILCWGPKIMLGAPIPVTWIVAVAAAVLVVAYVKRPYKPPKVRGGEYILSIPDTKRPAWLPPPAPPQNPHMEWAQRRFREYLEREAYRPKAEEEKVIMIKPPPLESEPRRPPEVEVKAEQPPETDGSVIVVLPSMPEEPTVDETVQMMKEGRIAKGVELTTDLLERLSNEMKSPERIRELVEEGKLKLSIEEPPLLGRAEELKDIERLILGGGHLAILGPSLDKRLIVERAFRGLKLGYAVGEAESEVAEFVKSILPKDLTSFRPEEALARLAKKGVTHIIVDRAERLEDASSLLKLAFPSSMRLVLLCESLASDLNVEAYELKPLSERDLGWIVFAKALRKGVVLEREAEQALVDEALREEKPEIIDEVVERISDGSLASVQEAFNQVRVEERTRIVESLDEGCRKFYEEARGLRALGEEDYFNLFNKCHVSLGMETSKKHYEEALEKLEKMGFERKTLNPLPIEDLLALASGKLDGLYLLNEEAVEKASEYFASPEPIVEAVKKGVLLPRVNGGITIQRSSRLEPIVAHLGENQSFVLIGEVGSGKRTCLEEAFKELRIRYLSGDAGSGIVTFLREVMKQLNIEVKAADRGRPTLEDHLDALHKIKEAGYSYLVAYNVAVGWRGLEAIEKLVRTCFAAKLNVAMTSTKPIEIEGLRVVEHRWSGQTFDWCIFAIALERGLILEREVRKLLMSHSSRKRNLATAAKIMEKAKSGKLEDIEQAIKELKPGEEAEEAKEIEAE